MSDRIDMTAKELHGVEFLAALDAQMHKHGDRLKPRLQMVPNGWRQYRLVESALTSLIAGLYDTMPAKQVLRVEHMMQHGEVKIDLAPVAKNTLGYLTVHENDLAVIATAAMQGECAMCIKDGDEIKKCPLRKALWEIATPDELPKFGCRYRAGALVGCKTEAEIERMNER